MKISCFQRYGPLNSKSIFGALIKSMQDAGDTVLVDKDDNCDVAVIWSVLWKAEWPTIVQYGTNTEQKINLL